MVEEQFYEAYNADPAYTDGYTWGATSNLGWFCYGEGIKSYETTWESSTEITVTGTNTTTNNTETKLSSTSAWAPTSNTRTLADLGTYTITNSTINSTKITWVHYLRRTDDEDRIGKAGYTVYRFYNNSTSSLETITSGTASLDQAGDVYMRNGTRGVATSTVSVANLGLTAGTTKTICQYIYHDATTTMKSDGSYESTGEYGRSEGCVTLTRPFEVTVESADSDVTNLFIGESGTYEYSVSVSGAPSEAVDLDDDGELEDPPTPTYRVFGLWVDTDGNDSGGDFLSGGTGRKAISGSASCSTIGATTSFVRSCEVLKEGSYTNTISGSGSIATPDEEAYVGAKYCVVVARNYFGTGGDDGYTFTGYEEGGDSWGVETISCGTTYKKPNLRITGASAYASGSIISTIVNKTTTSHDGTTYDSANVKFGSWSEYLLVSGSTISNFASGAYYSIGNTSNSASYFSPLTIANTNTSSLGSSGIDTGSTTFVKKLDAYLAKLDSLASSSSTTTSSQGGVSFTCNSSRGVCYSNSSNNSSGDVTIDSDIYSDTANPIYIIRTSGSVYINSNVSYIDAWIIADGGVYTCSDVGSITDLSHNTCNQALTINGPVYASNLTAYRTAGANGVTSTQSSARTSDAESAETIHFPIKTYVWAYEESVTSDVRIYEASSTELAPRV